MSNDYVIKMYGCYDDNGVVNWLCVCGLFVQIISAVRAYI